MTLIVKSIVALFVAGVVVSGRAAESPVALKVDLNSPGREVPEDFSGLSYETYLMLPQDGTYYFRPDNRPLITMLKTLGVKSIRVGGNSADKPEVNVPDEKDIDSLFAFAEASGQKIIYTLRLRDASSPKEDAKLAKYIMDHYKSDLTCFAIGNEPNMYAGTYDKYKELLQSFITAIMAPGVAPDAKFCGPSTTPGKAVWARDLAKDFGSSGHLALITQHAYPGGSARKVTDVAAGRDVLLSPKIEAAYQKFYDSFVPAAFENKLPYRLEETNSYFNGGAKNVSDTHAAALWGLDYMHWWACHGAAGLNFHTGDRVSANNSMTPSRYAVFWTSSSGYDVHPLAYALKAFEVGGHGRVVPVTIDSKDQLNVTAYSVLAPDETLYVTIINREHGEGSRDAQINLSTGGAYAHGQTMLMTAPGGDVAATTGTTFGGAAIKDDGTWSGKWDELPNDRTGQFSLKVPAASATVIKLTTK